MRIAFATGCLAPGRDGVGDHVRMLGETCARLGHAVALVSLAEPSPVLAGDEENLSILRMSARQTQADDGRAVRQWLDVFAPEWVSLHFVPYSFHHRGLFARSIPMLRRVTGAARRRHVYFHEVWIGAEARARIASRLVGWQQRRAVDRLLRVLRPSGIHTSIGYNRAALAGLGWTATVLPMFGNVPLAPEPPVRGESLPGVPPGALVCGMFGSLHPNWSAEPFMSDFAALATARRRPAVLAAVGALRAGTPLFARLADAWRGRITCLALGEHAAGKLARMFATFGFAVTSVPWTMVGKSGSAAALREHGLRVVVTNPGESPRFRIRSEELEPHDEAFLPYFRERTILSSALEKIEPRPGVRVIATRFLEDLGSWNHAR